MNTEMNELLLLLSLVVALSSIFIALFTSVIGNSKGFSSVLFASYLFCLGIGIAEPLYMNSTFSDQLRILLSSYTFLLGPILYCYCKAKVKSGSLGWRGLIHSVPFVTYLGVSLFGRTENWLVDLIIYEAFLIHVTLYSFYSWRVVCKFPSSLPQNFESSLTLASVRKLSTSSLLIFMGLGFITNFTFLVGTGLTTLQINSIQLILILYLMLVIFLSPELPGDVRNLKIRG